MLKRKAGGVKLIKEKDELLLEAKKMMGKILITQTGLKEKVKRLYLEEASEILKNFIYRLLLTENI